MRTDGPKDRRTYGRTDRRDEANRAQFFERASNILRTKIHRAFVNCWDSLRSRELSWDNLVLVQHSPPNGPSRACLCEAAASLLSSGRRMWTGVAKLMAIIKGRDGPRGSCARKASHRCGQIAPTRSAVFNWVLSCSTGCPWVEPQHP